MTNEEAFKEALKSLEEKTWIPSKWAYEMPIKIVWMRVRISQSFHFMGYEKFPKTYKDLLKIEKEMKKKRKEDETCKV